MAQWDTTDIANSSPIFAPSSVKLAPTRENANTMFANSTADAFVTGQTVSVYGVDAKEIEADGGKIAHTGWILRREGSGGRAGRVMTEVLVAGGITTDFEDTVYPDYTVLITSNPADKTVVGANSSFFTVVATSVPAGESLTYKWYRSNSTATTLLSNSGVYSNATTSTLFISNSAGLNGLKFRVNVTIANSSYGTANSTSANATLTVT